MTLSEIKKNIEKVIVGQNDTIDLLLIALLNEGHVLLESVPGTGKTMLAKTFAKSINSDFKRVQFTPDVLPSDITGIRFFNPKTQEFQHHYGPVMTNILLADEINRATPKTQSSLLEVMEERQVTIDGETHLLPSPFMVIATQNPVESQQGTFNLPTAQLDRFFIKIEMGYPNFGAEKIIIKKHLRDEPIKEIDPVFQPAELKELRTQLRQIKISEAIENYILEIVTETRDNPSIELGVSPRGTLAFFRAAQGFAFLDGRDYVTPEDVKKSIFPVLAHRILLSPEAYMTSSAKHVLDSILAKIAVPVEAGVL
ncbi:AAA family ATPase [Bacillus litorisediminis]|uniref:AAA family ATPase n=1 Tax=Bacillus litorisediminis TaxID=2922713 RepID=UPI001FAD6510|nr:MoxR family ATPase [Bacillus litorisediminis]